MTQIETYKYCCRALRFASFGKMQLNSLVTFSIILRVATCFEFDEFQYPGSCPEVRYITDFDFNRILGWWYRCFSTFSTPSCFNNDGQTVYAYPFNSSVAGVAICCRSAANPDQVTCSTEVGTGFIKPMSTAGMFSYEYDGHTYPTVVLDMDDDFLISYACKEQSQRQRRRHNGGHDEQIYVYSRSYELCQSLECRTRSVLKQNRIPWSHVKPVKQGPSIPYTTVPKPCSKN